MKNKIVLCTVFIFLLLLAGCGRTDGEEHAPILAYSIQEISIPEPDEDLTQDFSYIMEDDYRLVSGTLYRLATVFRENEGKVRWYLQSLSAPYEEWDTVLLETLPDLGDREVTVKQRGITEDGNVYFIYSGGNDEEYIFILREGTWLETDALPVADTGENIYTADAQALYRQEDGEREELLFWSSYGISLSDALMLWAESEDHMILADVTPGRRRLFKVENGEQSRTREKQQVVLAAYLTPSLQKSIEEFNRQSENYEVVVRDCYQESFTDLQERFRAEMIAGDGPDLIHNLFVPIYSYAKSGVLEPLDDWLPEDRLLPQTVESGRVEGHCYIAPYEFSLQSLITTREIAGERTQWTLGEMKEVMAERPAEFFYGGASGQDVLYCMIGMDEENTAFVDWEQGICHFDTEEFVSLLECSGAWADMRKNRDVAYGKEELISRLALVEQLWRTPATLESYYTNLEELGGSCVYIGYPTESGNGSFVEGWGFAINRSSTCKDGAKAFLEYLMSPKVQWERWEETGNLPVDRELLERVMKESVGILSDGQEAASSHSGIPGEEEIQYYWELLLNSKAVGNRYNGIQDIISEETAGYYEGNRDPWEVAGVLQNRVQLYLDEQV